MFEKKNKKQIYPIYLISIPKRCRASISDTSDTSASLITSASEIIRLICVFRVHVYFDHRFSGKHRFLSRAKAKISLKSGQSVFGKTEAQAFFLVKFTLYRFFFFAKLSLEYHETISDVTQIGGL